MRPIYLDNHSTTRVDDRVLAAMLPFFTEHYGNAASVTHAYGWEAEAAVTQAREIVAETIGATPEEIIFTSGATEANNLAIKGVAEAYFSQGRHIITVQTEHNAVLDSCRYLESLGFEVTYLNVDRFGLICLAELEKAMREDTILVSVMVANNEIGVIQPIDKIGELCHDRNILFHTDAAQAIGKIPLTVQNVDLMSITGHKLYAPKGIGALYVRRKNPRVQLSAQLHGGGHERGMRSGTLYTPLIVGLGKAIEIADPISEAVQTRQLRDRLWKQLNLDGIHLNGHPTQRLPGNLNISIENVDGQALLLGLQSSIAVSSGSACTAAKIEPSHVLRAIGVPDPLAFASIRFGIGRFNTEEDIDRAANCVRETVQTLRAAS
ncbi:MAG: aminotransferase class V-fold PLP-dependent enzyme [Plectolyngbya sp. WJT66-NPBG17]|nr:aminotransferase class V-fold PLP-dependent enzyme [Plectolyngbya sp. WJT66-NPBG17]